MKDHRLVHVRWPDAPPDSSRSGRCLLCGWVTPRLPTRTAVEDDFERVHMKDVRLARASIRRSDPSLENERDYYEEQATLDRVPPEQREQWQRMADEISRRLGDRFPAKSKQEELW